MGPLAGGRSRRFAQLPAEDLYLSGQDRGRKSSKQSIGENLRGK
jgi:hypothetical protein